MHQAGVTHLELESSSAFDGLFQDPKEVFYHSQRLLQHLQARQQQHKDNMHDHGYSRESEDDETGSQDTAWSRLGMDSPLCQSSSTLGDPAPVVYSLESGVEPEGDVLQHLVHTLQSEVKDSQATVYELESRLNMAEHSNRLIIEELKTLLASANGSMISQPASHNDRTRITRRGTSSDDDDSAAAYNRICFALQSLINAAQSAVQNDQTIALDSSSIKLEERNAQHPSAPQLSPWMDSLEDPGSSMYLASRSSPKNSLTLLHSTRVDYALDNSLPEFSPMPFYSGTDEVSKIYWRQKHEEQHDRYRKSCQRLTLELEGRYLGTTTESDDSETGLTLMRRSQTSRPSSAQSSVPSTPTTPNQPLQSILRSSQKTARLKKKRQVQFLNADIKVETSQESESSESTPVLYRKQQRQKQRQYTDRSVGSTHSRGVVMQLYELWQQTWLRTRIMHVITGSVEVVIIIWVVIRASRATLTWFGVQPASVKEWLTFIYGHRDSAGASAKELYAAIRRDGLQLRQIKAWNRKEPEALVGDLVAGAVASTSLISPSVMVYGPAKKVMAHAVTGVALALFSDGARRLLRKL
ncbi:hypothetical protein BGZ72_003060 [Mortierella alpina]|nr:hypothetical protein BGZ72_003060 [Mortierella alpina]